MKVLHVIPSLWRGDGGPTHALLAIEKALTARGVNVETATTDDAGPGKRNGKQCGQPLLEGGATHWYFRKRADFYKPAPSLLRWLSREVTRFDIVHIHALFSFTTTAAARAAHMAGVPYIVRPMGSLDRWGLQQRRPLFKQLSLSLIERPVLERAAAVHFTSESEAQHAAALGLKIKPVIIPLAVDTEAPGLRTPSDKVRLLFLSRLDPKKNVEGLLAALALLLDEPVRWEAFLAGDGDPVHVDFLKAIARRLQLDERVHWLGRVEGEAKARAFTNADVFVLPSHSENFGIAAAEALAAGLPCVLGEGVAIAADVSAAGAGVAVSPTPAAIAAGLRLIMDSETRERMSLAARQLAQERYSMPALGANLARLYTDLLFEHEHGFPGSR